MKKTKIKRNNTDIKSEYNFDYTKAKPNRFANIVREKTPLIPLEDDVAEVFSTPSEVNDALRAIITAFPQKTSKRKKSGTYSK
jgi:hypothetical protein